MISHKKELYKRTDALMGIREDLMMERDRIKDKDTKTKGDATALKDLNKGLLGIEAGMSVLEGEYKRRIRNADRRKKNA